MSRPGKRQLNVFLSDESFAAWRAFCDEQGVSVTAMLEALGFALAKVPPRPTAILAEAIREARLIDSERRRGSKP